MEPDERTITLTLEQHLRAADVGYRRRCVRLKEGYGDRHRNGSMWEGDIEGACAELAAALYLGVPWTGEDVFDARSRRKMADIGERTEVRWTAPGGDPALWLDAARDELDRYYVLVTGWAPEFVILGLIGGEAGTRVRWSRCRLLSPSRRTTRRWRGCADRSLRCRSWQKQHDSGLE